MKAKFYVTSSLNFAYISIGSLERNEILVYKKI